MSPDTDGSIEEQRGDFLRLVTTPVRRGPIAKLLPAGADVCAELVPFALKFSLELWEVLDAE